MKKGKNREAELEERLPPGPRKERKKGAPSPRFSNHKVRSAWFQSRTAWPVREAPVRTLIRERARASKELESVPLTAQWEMVGPSNIGGRLTAIVSHPDDPDRVWAGAAGGGVWASTDAGRTWRPLWHKQKVLNVGSLAIDPKNPDLIYCGTGEANLSADSYPGVGIYRSANGGKTWQLRASSLKTGIPNRIGVIAIDPFNSKHIRVGGIGYGEAGAGAEDFGGMYVSLDRGLTWKREQFISSQNYWCHSIVFHPSEPGTIYATFTARGARNGIWRSEDNGKTWAQLRNGLPDPSTFGRTSLAIAPSKPNVIYALASNSLDLVLGVFRSANGGDTWTSVGGTHFKNEQQMSYGNTIAVHPTNHDHVICGGVDLHLTTNGGAQWKQATRWDADRGEADYAHADHHALLMPKIAPGRIYDANDGGLDVSIDGGRTWTNRSRGLAVTMYYDADVAQSDGRNFGGGSQDNGTLVTVTGGIDDHFEILGGDGGWLVYDPEDADHLFASYYNMNIFRFRSSDGWKRTTPPAPEAERNAVWMVFITMDPNEPTTVFTGSRRMWRTKTDGNKWIPVSGVLDGSAITAIEVAPADSDRVYVGTENGGFFRSTDGGDTWSQNLSGAELPGFSITRLESGPEDADLLFATIANFGHSHVFRSRDGGINWEDVDEGRLPDVPHHAVVIPPDDAQTLYVCNDAGVYVSPDLGGTWRNVSLNLPNVMMVDLAYHLKDGTLTAASYGRSIWKIKVRQP